MRPAAVRAGAQGEVIPGLPERFQAGRLDLRPLEDADRPLYISLYTDADVMCHVGAPLSTEAASRAFEAVRRQMRRDPPQAWYWVACVRGSGRDAGLLALMFDPGRGSAEFGMLMFPWAQGRGHATEAVAALVAHAFADPGAPGQGGGVSRLHTRHARGHPAGPRVMERLGFVAAPAGGGMLHWYLDRPG